MSDYRKQIKQHQAEIGRISQQLPGLKQVRAAALEAFETSRVNRRPYPHEPVQAVSEAEERMEQHRKEIAHLERLAEWEEGVKTAPATMKAARRDMDAASADVKSLTTKRNSLAVKLEALREEHALNIKEAQSKEQEAARRYAEALAGADTTAEQRAKADLDAAAQAARAAEMGTPGASSLTAAVTAEIDKIDEALSQAQERHDNARRALLLAARSLWSARFDKAAHELAELASFVAAAEKALGSPDSLANLHIPLHAPTGPRYLGTRHVVEARARVDLDQLTAA